MLSCPFCPTTSKTFNLNSIWQTVSRQQPAILLLCTSRMQKIILSGCHLKLHGASSTAGRIRYSTCTMDQVVFLISDLSIAIPNQAVRVGQTATAETCSEHSQNKYSLHRPEGQHSAPRVQSVTLTEKKKGEKKMSIPCSSAGTTLIPEASRNKVL